MITTNTLLESAQQHTIDYLNQTIIATQQVSPPSWSTPQPWTQQLKHGNIPGVYAVLHSSHLGLNFIPNAMCIGYSNKIGGRKSSHTRTFNNQGNTIIAPGGTSFYSNTGSQMYHHDDNIENWFFSFMPLSNALLAKQFEHELVHQYKPPFNNPSHASGLKLI